MLLFFVACFAFDPRTRVEELQVLAIQSDPAEIVPSEGVANLNVLIADPKNEGAEVLLWSCTDFGDGCMEKDLFPESTEGWVYHFVYAQPLTTLQFSISPFIAPLIQELPEELIPFTGTSIWVLACVPGACDVFQDAQAGTVSSDFLTDPQEMVSALPMGSYSLAKKNLLVSERPLEERAQNPEITSIFAEDSLVLSPMESKDLNFNYMLNAAETEDARLYGYSSAGYFVEGPPRGYDGEEIPQEGEWSLTWQAQETAEQGSMYVVLENGDGGIGIWTGEAAVE